MDCRNINNLVLDERDLEVIQDIRRVQQAGQRLQRALPAGVMANIFVGSNSVQVSYNISSTDWEQFAKAMMALPNIVRTRIYQEATFRQLEGGLTHEQRLFWKAVAEGCRGF